MRDKNEIHYFEVKDIVTQFVSAFDSIVISRYTGKVKDKSLRVRYVYAPKQKVLHDLVNKAQHITVPAIAVNITSISRDSDRLQSKNVGHYIGGGSNYSYHVPQPVPINISISVNIITRYQDDMDQILANFIPYSDPYIIISWKMPEEFAPIGTELRSEVLWDGNISLTQPVDMGEGNKYRNIADTSFVIKGWLFKKHPETPTGNIYEIDTKYYSISSVLEDLDNVNLPYDAFSLSAYPTLSFAKTTKFVVGTSPTYKLEGTNFDYTTAVYLSADNANVFSDSLSSYTNFDGIPLSATEYQIISDNVIYVNVRLLQSIGNVSIIIENPSGYVVSLPITAISL